MTTGTWRDRPRVESASTVSDTSYNGQVIDVVSTDHCHRSHIRSHHLRCGVDATIQMFCIYGQRETLLTPAASSTVRAICVESNFISVEGRAPREPPHDCLVPDGGPGWTFTAVGATPRSY